MPLWLRIKGWFEWRKSKLPWWVIIVWIVFKEVPDLFGATIFWLDWLKAAKAMEGKVGSIATIIDSPWFSAALILVGLFGLRFVGESRYAIRYPVMPYIGWGLVGLLALAFWSVLVAGYVASCTSQQGGEGAKAKIDSLTQANQHLQQKVEALEQQVLPWVLPDDQKRKLADALSKIPPGVTYKLKIHVIPGCAQCSGYTNDLGEVWTKAPGWEVQGSTNLGLNPRLIGVNVVPDIEDCPPEELQFVMDALTAAGIKYGQALSKGQLGSGCLVLVGNRPQD